MVKREVLERRLKKLDEYIKILKTLQKYKFEEFSSDPEHYGSAERFLQLAIESINDIGNHIIADEALGMVKSYADIPTILFEKGYIDQRLKEIWIRMIGFRNTLVHDYTDVDIKIVHDVLQKNVEDFAVFTEVFAALL